MPSSTSRPVLLCSKTVTQILAWVTLLAAIYLTAVLAWPHFLISTKKHIGESWTSVTIYTIFTLIMIFFPLGGLLGDVCLGRYKTVISAMVAMALSMVMAFVTSMLTVKENWSKDENTHIVVAILVITTFLLFTVSFSLFTSNIIQFGLDQLMERPSESLGVFVHWMTWAFKLGYAITEFINAATYCARGKAEETVQWLLHFTPILFFALIIMFLVIAYCTRRHFNRDRVKYNPYKMIFKVLNFARKNKYPVGPVSAFAYCDDFRPSRLDYAKERYGGPFTTSDVEDVKAFKNVFLVLLALGPVFTLDPTASSFLFGLFSEHTGGSVTFGVSNATCENGVDLVFSGVVMLIAIPIYMWVIYSVLRNRTPKILHRLAAGLLIYIVAVVSMLAIDITGHTILYSQHNQTQAMCLFVAEEMNSTHTLNLSWVAIAIPKFLTSTGYHITLATGYEFISAQSPHAMQGVLVGSLFAILGVFRAIGSLLLIPFSLEGIWGYGYLGQHPPVVSCGFGYYLVCITVATIGFISFIVAVKRYKYRRRDEEPYSQACVEEIFARRIASDLQYRDRKEYKTLPGSNEY